MTDQWRVRIILTDYQPLSDNFVLPVSATVQEVILRCYEYANSIGPNENI
jgi:hypothetical protein